MQIMFDTDVFTSKINQQVKKLNKINVASTVTTSKSFVKNLLINVVEETEKILVEFHEETLIPFLATHPGITQTLSINDTFHSVGWLQRKARVEQILREKGMPVSADDSFEG